MKKEELILIVEDNVVNRDVLVKLFEEFYEIAVAENGEEALSFLDKYGTQVSVMILDLYMPVMDGYAVLEEISRHDKWKNIPIVITTAEDAVESDLRLVDMGVSNIIHKPINADVVRKQIINIVEQHQEKKLFMKQYRLQQQLLSRTTNTFLVSYHFKSREAEVEENYKNYLCSDFSEVFDRYPFNMEKYVLPKDLNAVNRFLNADTRDERYDEIEVRLRVDVMHYEWYKLNRLVHFDVDGALESATFLFKNIENEIEAKEKLTFMAVNDMLTHIPNMRTFSDDVRDMLIRYPWERFIMITMDIYQFRLVNKLFGYSEGDNVLRYLATKLQEIVEAYPKGVYCRMASDIFYACISESEDVEQLLRTLQDCMRSYPIKFDLRLCCGIYRIENPEEDVECMIEHSAYARLEGKKGMIHSVQYYDESLQKKEYFESFVVSEMKYALQNGQFEVYLQPKCNSLTNQIIGSEALVRWNNPEKGYLSPGIFIPIFEKNGFITELDYFVYEKVCETIRSWIDRGITPLPVSVNVSRCDLYDVNLLNHIWQIVEKNQIPHELIEFEITESAFVLESDVLMNFTQKLRENGFHILIDDFGSGYSSLNSLKDMMADVLKIDIKFLPISMKELKAPIILSAVIEMAQNLGLDVVAEGVETKEQLDLLSSLNCEKVQGYYYYKPMPIIQFEETLRSKES